MSNLYGQVVNERGSKASKGGAYHMQAWVQTEIGRITITMNAAGDYVVATSQVRNREEVTDSDITMLASGNLNAEMLAAVARDADADEKWERAEAERCYDAAYGEPRGTDRYEPDEQDTPYDSPTDGQWK